VSNIKSEMMIEAISKFAKEEKIELKSILNLNEIDAKFNEIPLAELLEMLK
jgi:hypothetical protein